MALFESAGTSTIMYPVFFSTESIPEANTIGAGVDHPSSSVPVSDTGTILSYRSRSEKVIYVSSSV
jgi:hypothetical protein